MKNSKLIVVTGPSGVGKATIEKILFANDSLKLQLSCSATTRKPRENEIDGTHYYFLSDAEFDKKIKSESFIEWNEHFSKRYGTLKSEIKEISDSGKRPFIEVEHIGALKIFETMPKKCILSIFIAPPSVEDLKQRLRLRGTETNEEISLRLARVDEEMATADQFDYVVINDDVKKAAIKIAKIIKKES